jgi:hypothetical protein
MKSLVSLVNAVYRYVTPHLHLRYTEATAAALCFVNLNSAMLNSFFLKFRTSLLQCRLFQKELYNLHSEAGFV